ncbi:RecX family transcriptional regulator, partial [Nonlabens mediterrranea]|nr:RecX family transcriptional regulator [Nonlabens mediterrranea]
ISLDQSFVKSFARGEFRNKHWGRNRIVRELKSRTIGERNINIALNEINPVEYDASFDTLSRKRYEQLHNEKDKYRKRKKLADYLLYRGWEGDLVYDKVKQLIP